MRKSLFIAALSLALLIQLALLRRADYSKSWLAWAGLADVRQTRDPFVLDELDWNPARFAGHSQLASYRRVVETHCPGRGPLETVICLSDLMAVRFPHGVPQSEPFDAAFDPESVLAHHLAGEPGHCVSRAALITTALLATGVHARFVQLLPAPKEAWLGHNALEVWVPGSGWVFFDPTFGGALETAEGKRSAAELLASGRPLVWRQLGKVPTSPDGEVLDGSTSFAGAPSRRFDGQIAYPEPWLYTRVGKKLAPPPFNGKFVVVGSTRPAFFTGHRALLGAIPLTAVGVVWQGASLLRDWFRRRRKATLPAHVPVSDPGARLNGAAE